MLQLMLPPSGRALFMGAAVICSLSVLLSMLSAASTAQVRKLQLAFSVAAKIALQQESLLDFRQPGFCICLLPKSNSHLPSKLVFASRSSNTEQSSR